MAPVVSNYVVPFQQVAGQSLWKTSTIRREALVNSYEANPTKFLSGPISIIIFINAFNLAYTVKLGKSRYGTPEYNALMRDAKAKVPLRLIARDIIGERSLTEEPTMRNLKRYAADTKIFGSLIWYAYEDGMRMSSRRKTEMLGTINERQRNYKILTEDAFNKTMTRNLLSPWRQTSLIANFDSCLLYGFQNNCGSHFGVIAAHNIAQQRVLVLDVKYGRYWVKFDALLKAMRTISPESGFPRGMIEIDMVFV